jgi:undecaprenyl-diphosphatase
LIANGGPLSYPPERLPVRHAVVLGAVQGPAELLPVSSSGHLVLVPCLLGWGYSDLDPELRKSFEVALHAGGAAALLLGLRREVADYLRSFGPHNVATLSLSFAPAALAAYALEREIEGRLGEPRVVALALITGSVAMAIADGRPQRRTRNQASVTDALLIGFAQAFALVPGVSRNGATLAAARWLRFRRGDANVISRQIALPVIIGASGLKALRLAGRELPRDVAHGMLAGAASAFISTLASLRLIAMLERSRSLMPYALYRGLLGTLTLLVLRRRRGAKPLRKPRASAREASVPERVKLAS